MIAAGSLAWATAPASAALIAYFLWRGRLSGRLFLDALAIGVTLGAAVAFAETPFDLRADPLRFSPQTIAFLFAGLPEEGVKMLGVAAFLRTHWLARDRRDVTLAAGALSLGFSALENIFYLANANGGWAALGVDRALTATPFHVFLGLAGGFVVASVRPGGFGVALGLAAWIGLAAIHGVYDFAVFAGATGAHPPEVFQRIIGALGLDAEVVLRAMMAGAEAAAALCAGFALASLRKTAPTAARTGRLAAIARSRGAGWAFGAPLALGAMVALAGAGFASAVLDSPEPFLAAAMLAIMPLALGVLFVVFPAHPEARPLSPRVRRAVAALGSVAAVAAVASAIVWGPAQWRGLTVLRFEARGARLAARGDYDRAIEALGQALKAAPDRVEALAQRAAIYAAAQRYDAALADLDKAVRVAPENVALYLQRADVDRQRNDPLASLADLGSALKLKPDDPEILAMQGQARLESGDRVGAYKELAAARRLAPDNGLVRRVFAAWDVDAGDFDAGLRDLNAELHADPRDAAAAFQRGRLWLYKGDPARALVDLAQADRDPAFLYPALWRFIAHARLKQDGAAELGARLAASGGKWPAPVARMLMGRMDLAAAKAAASDAGERCEADFYFAASRVADVSADEVAPRLRDVLRECPTGFIEYEGAKAELRRLGRWPPTSSP